MWPRRQTYRSVLGVLWPVTEVDLFFSWWEEGDVKQERKNTFLSYSVLHSRQEEGEKKEKENNANL